MIKLSLDNQLLSGTLVDTKVPECTDLLTACFGVKVFRNLSLDLPR